MSPPATDARGAGRHAGGVGRHPAVPFYAGMARIITSTHLNERLTSAFVSLSSQDTFPPVVAIYSALLGVFVPSGGSKWVRPSGHTLEVERHSGPWRPGGGRS
ncbi:MAG: TIGR00366 family protein [Vicinamibacterales bacterium]